MTHKQQMLAALRGRPTDRLPWAPRLDLWYNARRKRGTLPAGLEQATLMEITDAMGVGYHAVIPDFKDLRSPEDDVHRALGIYNLKTMPYRTELHDVDWHASTWGDVTTVRYTTPVGSFTTRTLYNDAMRDAGITITHILEHAIAHPGDYAPVGFVFEHARVVPNGEGYEKFHRTVGERGLAVAFLCLAASPMHLLHRELMAMDHFFCEMMDEPAALDRCAEQIGVYYDQMIETAASCNGRCFCWGQTTTRGLIPRSRSSRYGVRFTEGPGTD